VEGGIGHERDGWKGLGILAKGGLGLCLYGLCVGWLLELGWVMGLVC